MLSSQFHNGSLAQTLVLWRRRFPDQPGSESGENLGCRCATMTKLSQISSSWSNCSPPSAVASPQRSTVPLVDYWRTPERVARDSAFLSVGFSAQDEPMVNQRQIDRGYNYFHNAEARGWSDFSHGTPVACHHRIDSQQNHALNRCLRDKNPVEGILMKGRQAVDGEGMFARNG